MLRSEIPEEKEHTIAKFICGLSKDIAYKVELQTYHSFEDVYKLSTKVEKQLKSMKSFTPKKLFKESTYQRGSPSYSKPYMTPTAYDKPSLVKNEPPRADLKNKKCFEMSKVRALSSLLSKPKGYDL